MPLADIQTRLYAACLIYSLAVGGWAFYNAFKGRTLSSNFWGTLAINEVLFIITALFDLILILNGGILPGRPGVHLLYTATGVLTIPLIYTLTQGKATHREASFYGTACLFLAGIAIRAIITSVV
jgi:uncharacterized membrane protein